MEYFVTLSKKATMQFPVSKVSSFSSLKELSTLLFLFILNLSIQAQCDQYLLKQANTRLGNSYKDIIYKERGNRCEGFYEKPLSANFSIVNFTQGQLRFKPNEEEVICLEFTNNNFSEINVRATPKLRNIYYQMDTKILTGEILEWPVNEVLLRYQYTRDCNNIGVFGYTGVGLNTTYIPIKPSSKGSKSSDIFYRIDFLSHVELGNVHWRIIDSKTTNSPEWKKYGLGNEVAPGELVSIRLPNNLKGKYLLEIKSYSQGAEESITKFHISI